MHPDPHIRIGQLLAEAQAIVNSNPTDRATKRRIDQITNLAAAIRLNRKAEIMLLDAKAGAVGRIADLEEIRALAEMLVRGLEE